jgi:hypothetical protein
MKPLDPIKEAAAAKALRESMAAIAGDDADLIVDMIEGETSLFEALDGLLERSLDDRAHVKGLGDVIADLEARKRRFEKRIETSRALIEQALMIAEIEEKIERPIATIFLTRRAPSVVIDTEAEIPAKFWVTGDPKLDKKAIGAALKSGESVPGAALSNQAPTLTLRFA